MITYENNRSLIKETLYHQNDVNLNFALHLHNSFEFLFVYEGEINITIDEKSFICKKNNAAIILPNQIHAYDTINSSKSYICIFSNGYVYDFYEKIKNQHSTNPIINFDDISIISMLQSNETSYYMQKSLLYKIIDMFNQQTDYYERNIKLNDNINIILTFIEQNYSQMITVKDIANIIGYDYHYITNQLQKNLHTTFRNLLNEYRIQQAQHLLKTTSLTITEIAISCGYDSICSFNRNFKNIAKTTPSNYKKMN